MRKLTLTVAIPLLLGLPVVAAQAVQAAVLGSPAGIRAALQDASAVDQVRYQKCWRHGRNHCRRSPVQVRRYYPYAYYASPYAYYPSVGLGWGYYGHHLGIHHGGHGGGHDGFCHLGGHDGFGGHDGYHH
jgi:hypothetical protein